MPFSAKDKIKMLRRGEATQGEWRKCLVNKGCLDIQVSLSGEEVVSDNRSLRGTGSLSKVNSFRNLDVLYKRVTSVFRSLVSIVFVVVVFQNNQFNGLYAKEAPFNNPSQKRRDNGRYKVVSGSVDLKCSWANVYHFLISFQDLGTTLHVIELHPLGSFFLKEGSTVMKLNNFINLNSTSRILEI